MNKKMTLKNYKLTFLSIFFLLLLVPFLIKLVQTAQYYFGKAEEKPANIVVDVGKDFGPIPQPWKALAQGGEEDENMLQPVISQIKNLKPEYIRIDHIFNRYQLVEKNGAGEISYNWTRLDKIIDDILKTGALPFISLSYMPTQISQDGNVTSPPADWNHWSQIVENTIEHLSGPAGKNLKDIYYEVWNEPDLFGQWKAGRNPDYFLLYRYAALGAQQAQNVNQFFLGGPATTSLYPSWFEGLYEQNLRVDFISWHYYKISPDDFDKDIKTLKEFLEKNPKYFDVKRIITEWGSVSDNSPYHDTAFDAAHSVAMVRKFLNEVDLAFAFEIKDGPSPEGKKYWGRWGMLTHEKYGIEKKPRYQAFELLNKMDGKQLSVTGEGTNVTGFAVRDGENIKLILVNFDSKGKHQESVPVTFINLRSSEYTYKETFLLQKSKVISESPQNGSLQKVILMPVNSVVLLELEPKV